MDTLTLTCKLCGTVYRIGEDSVITTMEDVQSAGMMTVVLTDGRPTVRTDLVSQFQSSWTPEWLEEQKRDAPGKIAFLRESIGSGQQRFWYCRSCDNEKSPFPYPDFLASDDSLAATSGVAAERAYDQDQLESSLLAAICDTTEEDAPHDWECFKSPLYEISYPSSWSYRGGSELTLVPDTRTDIPEGATVIHSPAVTVMVAEFDEHTVAESNFLARQPTLVSQSRDGGYVASQSEFEFRGCPAVAATCFFYRANTKWLQVVIYCLNGTMLYVLDASGRVGDYSPEFQSTLRRVLASVRIEGSAPPARRKSEATDEQRQALREKISKNQQVVVSGQGFEGLELGCLPEDVHFVFGEPNEITTYTDDVYHSYESSRFVFDEATGLLKMMFLDKDVPVITDKGIRFNSSKKQLLSAYGTPTRRWPADDPSATDGWLEYGNDGTLFDLDDGRVGRITIFGTA